MGRPQSNGLVELHDDNTSEKAKLCEEYGWPNTTHSGEIMYENTYFRTRGEAHGNKYIICRTFEDFERTIKNYFAEAI